MDLLATVRKEGSRGGRADFKWSDVQNSTRREHYLGHSLMAPVGRWAKGRDLNWYAKGDDQGEDEEDPAQKAARERKEEIRRVKEAEEDALARALGLPVPQRNNANMEPVSDKRRTDQNAVDSTVPNDDSKGQRYGKTTSKAEEEHKELQYALREHRRRHRDDDRPRSAHGRDRDRDRDRDRRRHASDRDRDSDHRKGRDRDRERSSRRSRSRSPTRRKQNHRVHERERDRSRSRSPYRLRSDSKRH